MKRRNSLIVISAAQLAAQRCLAAQDAPWPSKPVRIFVPGGAGGVLDVRARWLAERLAPGLGQPVFVENKPGAGGNIGRAEPARSAPDGYTIVVVHQGTMAVNPHLYARVGYGPLADFAPPTRLGVGGLLLTVPPELPVKPVGELVQLGRSRPGALKYDSPGIGTPPHMAAAKFSRMAGIEATHVPYKGADAVRGLIGGHLSFSIEGGTVEMTHVKSGRLRALGVTTAQRMAALSDVPTVAEAGVPGYEYVGWVGLALPAATPKPIVARLHAEIAQVLGSAEAREWFAQLGAERGLMAPEAIAELTRVEHAKWGKVVRDAGIRIE